jgi:HPt (histidine-containing phosphotransfer) domain-containing protein
MFATALNTAILRLNPDGGVRALGDARLWTCRVLADGRHAFLLRLFAPAAAATVSGQTEATDTAVPPAPTFDYAEALARMDAEIIEILAPAFLEHGPGELAALQAALAAGDAEEVLRRAHGLKGTLAAFGAAPAERCAAQMETMAKAGDLQPLQRLLAVDARLVELALLGDARAVEIDAGDHLPLLHRAVEVHQQFLHAAGHLRSDHHGHAGRHRPGRGQRQMGDHVDVQ